MAAVPRPTGSKKQPKPLKGWEEDLAFQMLSKLKEGVRKGHNPWPELDVAVVATLFSTGVRSSELLSMNINSIDGEPPDEVVRVHGKGDKERAIPIEPVVDEVLGDYLESRKDRYPTWKPKGSDPLFVRSKIEGTTGGKRMTRHQLDYLLRSALEATGYANRVAPGTMAHAFRHTYGTVLAANGAPITAIRKLMGHSSVTTSQGYIDSLARDERAAAAKNTVYGALARLRDTD